MYDEHNFRVRLILSNMYTCVYELKCLADETKRMEKRMSMTNRFMQEEDDYCIR